MRWFRFKIRSIIGFIVICGVALAALKESTDLWEKGVFSVTLLILLVAALFAIHRRGASRAFWLGFALFGSVYLGLSLIPAVEARLVSSQGLAYLHSRLPGQALETYAFTVSTMGSGSSNTQLSTLALSPSGSQLATGSSNGSVQVWDLSNANFPATWGGAPENFVRIGHTLFALLLAWIGGIVSRRLAGVKAERDGVTLDGMDNSRGPLT